ncbi:ATP-binding protein [Gracilibacillus alcaliphilus]|uniref:ATP-binding protein n=1 Tax=Gracilibacillus alcaliphilus TaxID=1401441 RepID=UPI001956A088|nr:ATP-binding protein [Gracilibacillus alcaliphilus]MBM7678027.1 sensor histidine kinase YesM [Gracilibacillus alcaliphilus]
MTRKKIIIVLLFLILLTSLRFVWLDLFDIGKSSFIQQGQVHLTEQEPEEQSIIKLKGEWGFYPEQLITPGEVNQITSAQDKVYMEFPDQWFTYIQDKKYTYGTFHLEATVDETFIQRPLAIYIPRFPSASKIYINGELVGESGNPSIQTEDFLSRSLPYHVIFQTESPQLDILIQASHDQLRTTYSAQPLLFGTADDIYSMMSVSTLSKIVVMIFTLLLTIAAIFLLSMRYKPKLSLYFSLLMISIFLMVLLDPEGVALLNISMDTTLRVKSTLIVYILIAIFLVKFIQYFLPDYALKSLNQILPVLYAIYGLLVIILPVSIILENQWILGIVLILSATLATVQVSRANLAGMQNIFILMLAGLAILNNVVWSFVKHRMDLVLNFYPLDILMALILFEGFWIGMFLQHVKDIKEKNRKLLLANKSRDDFLANTSHEMRNPLHSMMHIAQYVLDNPENKITNKDRQDLILLTQIGRKMSMLINDLIDLSQIREHNLRLDKKAVDLHGQIRVVMDMLAHVVEGKPLQIINKVSPSFPALDADENRLNQVLLNLLHNAVKFTKEGTIVIQAEVINGMAVIEVADSGKGINETDIDKIFLSYEQVSHEDNSYNTGTGLGLAITKELIELQGGTIHVESEVGKGTVFRFTLALFEGSPSVAVNNNKLKGEAITTVEEQPQPVKVSETANLQFRVLLVDDERINLTVISKILDTNRYDIMFADNGPDALEYLNEQQFDLVISDVMMPGMSGFELTRRIREHYNLSELPVLLLTARARLEDVEAGFIAGANDYVIKPIEPLELRARVRVLTDLKTAVIERLHMEAAWLRAQINPHFIFNTINAIYSLMEFDQKKMRELLDQFIYFLQTSFDFQNTNNLVSLEQELKLVDAYLTIEEARFGNRMQIDKHIEVDSASILVPPLIIQTLVENAVKHGILSHQQGGRITIEAVDAGETCEIRVKDDGVGLPEEVKEMLRAKVRVGTFGIGLWNTEKRLQQYIGKGLSITSEAGKGTSISFQLPKG